LQQQYVDLLSGEFFWECIKARRLADTKKSRKEELSATERASKKAELKIKTGTRKRTLKGEGILEHLGMAATPNDQFYPALFGKAESVIIVCAISDRCRWNTVVLLQAEAERGLIRVIRSSRNKRQTEKSAINTNSSETVPHCPVCNALMVKRLGAPRCECGFELLGLQHYPKSRHAAD